MAPDRPDDRPHVLLFTDGACIGNPGPGGWAFILKHPLTGRSKESSGGEHATTNNRMEILSVIRGLEALKGPSRVDLHSDSQYVVKAITDWMPIWKRFGWKKSAKAKQQIKNADLWQRLDDLLQSHHVRAQWVRGHNGHIENERCDELADAAAARIAKTPPPVTATSLLPPAVTGGGLFAIGTGNDDEIKDDK
jgi:ribonuclease HI